MLFISSLFFALNGMGQDLPPATQQQLEGLADALQEENPEDDQFLQQLDYFRKHPLDLNTANAEELQAIKFINDLQITNLIRYRKLLGSLINIYELQAVPSWDLLTIQKILPYVRIGSAVSIAENLRSRFRGADQSLLFRMTRVLEKSKGYDTSLNNHYLGDRNHLLFRYRYQYKDLLYFGLTADKDAGEPFFQGRQNKGFDFYSFHFFAKKLGWIKAIALGDYTVNLGQGLIQWQSLAFGKSSEVMSIKRQSPVLLPYRSSGEFYFNRGLGITLQKKNLEASLFFSYKKVGGSMVKDSLETFSGLLTSGYYRTPSEIADKNKVHLTSFGGNLSYQTSYFKIGFNAIAHQFNIPLQKRDEPYNYYALSGKKLMNASVDYSYTYKNIHLFGETAADRNAYLACINGALITVDPRVDLSLLYRNIRKEYQTLFGNAFTENAAPVNEKGFYSGVALRPVAGWQLNAYADFFQFPWIKYRVNAPSRGFDYMVQLSYQPNKQSGMYVRYKNKNKPVDGSGNGPIDYPENHIKQNLRLHLSQQLSSALSIESRLELVWFSRRIKKSEEGFLSYVEGKYGKRKWAANVRLQYFETRGFNTGVYVYESDVLYSVSVPVFYDKGLRYYFNFRFGLGGGMQCWVRWAQTLYNSKDVIGSGLDETRGDSRSDIRIQMQYSFK